MRKCFLFSALACGLFLHACGGGGGGDGGGGDGGGQSASVCTVTQEPLPFSASYNCPAFSTNGQAVLPSGCSDISDCAWFGEPVDTIGCTDAGGPHYSQLTSDANRSGSTGLGSRQWVGPQYTNGFGINFIPTSSVNIRWYERYNPGINLGNNPHKDVYIRNTWTDFTHYAIPEPDSQNGDYRIVIDGTTVLYAIPSISGLIDGSWHCYEVHLDPSNVKVYIDGTKYIDRPVTIINTWSAVVFGSNTVAAIGNTSCLPIDYDDIAITAGTYIGP